MKTKFYLLIIIGLLQLNANAQNKQWVFGKGNHIEFNGNSYALQPSKKNINAYENSASISNENGQLVLYSDSRTVWNAYDEVIENGNYLKGHNSATSMAIVKQAKQKHIYYIFTVESNLSSTHLLCYSVVDMSLNNGHGKVIQKNNILNWNCDEKIAVTSDCNQNGSWIIAHIAQSNLYISFRLDQYGLNSTPIFSQVNSSYSKDIELGYLKFSTDGRFLANAKCHARNLDLNEFDNSRGIIKPYDDYTLNFNNHDQSFYGLAFSPNSQILYASCLDEGMIYQFNLALGRYNWKKSPNVLLHTGNQIGALQLTPMNTIWICSTPGSKALHCIQNPNVFGFGCMLQINQIKLNSNNYLGLPNFNETIAAYNAGIRKIYSKNSSYTIVPLSAADHYIWSDGSLETKKTVTQSGLYVVKLFNANNCLFYTDSIQVEFTTMVKDFNKKVIYVCSNTQYLWPKFTSDDSTVEVFWSNDNINNGLPSSGTGQIPSFMAPSVHDSLFSQIKLYASNNITPAYARTITLVVIPSIQIQAIPNQTVCYNSTLNRVNFQSNYKDCKIHWVNTLPSIYIADSGSYFIPEIKIIQLPKDESHTIHVIATHKLCPSTETSFKIDLIAPLNIDPVSNISICGLDRLNTVYFKCNKAKHPLFWQNQHTELGIDSVGIDSLTQHHTVNPLHNVSAPIMVYASNHGCQSDTMVFTIRINSKPIVEKMADTLICSQQYFNGIQANCAHTHDSIVWKVAQPYLSPAKTGINPLPSYYIPKQNKIKFDAYKVIAYNQNCVSDTMCMRVMYQISPSIITPVLPEICSGDWHKSITLSCIPNSAVAHWSNLSSELLQTQGDFIIPAYPTKKASAEQIHTFIARPEYLGCLGDSLSIETIVHAAPKAQFNIKYPNENDDIIQYKIQLNNQSIGATVYEWDFGDNSYSQAFNTNHIYEKNAIHKVQLFVQNEHACSDTMTQLTKLFHNNQFFVPNAFSPNGDHLNESIQIHGINDEVCSFKIFNRWGELVFETQDNQAWNGTYQDQACMQGVYTYVANIQSKHRGNIELRGSLTLLK